MREGQGILFRVSRRRLERDRINQNVLPKLFFPSTGRLQKWGSQKKICQRSAYGFIVLAPSAAPLFGDISGSFFWGRDQTIFLIENLSQHHIIKETIETGQRLIPQSRDLNLQAFCLRAWSLIGSCTCRAPRRMFHVFRNGCKSATGSL